jgi:hypothetical protein
LRDSSDLEGVIVPAIQGKWWQCGQKNNLEISKEFRAIFIVQSDT